MDWLASWFALTNGASLLDNQLDSSMKTAEVSIKERVGAISDFLRLYGDRLDIAEIIHLDAVISETLGIFLGRAMQIGLVAPIIPALRDRDWSDVQRIFTPVSEFVRCRDHIRAASMRIINNQNRSQLEPGEEGGGRLLVWVKTTITKTIQLIGPPR